MKHLAALVLLIALWPVAAAAQEHQSTSPITEGMPLSVSVVHDLSTTHAKLGDPVQLIFSGDVTDKSGKVVLSKKSKLTGHVTAVTKREKNKEARLAILVDHAESDGTSLPIHAVLCGTLKLPFEGHWQRVGNGQTWMGPPSDWQLPRDLQLEPMTDPNIGATLVSKEDNIALVRGRPFFICQQTTSSPTSATDGRPIVPPAALPPGVQLIVTLEEDLDASKVRSGDAVEMAMYSNLLGPGHTIAIPQNAKVTGRVIASQAASGSAPSELAVVVERASWSGAAVPFVGYISDPPTLPNEAMSQMLMKGGFQALDLRNISVEELPSGGAGLTRPGETIRLPRGTQLVFRTR